MIKDEFDCTFGIRASPSSVTALLSERNFTLDSLPSHIEYLGEAKMLGTILDPQTLVVLDGYAFDSEYQRILKGSGLKVISIDDTGPYHFYSDCIINHAPGISSDHYSCEQYSRLFLGPQYALLREPFSTARPKTSAPSSVRSLFISFGGADPHNFTLKLLTAAWNAEEFETITVVTGGAYQFSDELNTFIANKAGILVHKNLRSEALYQEIFLADVAVVPASTMLFEVLSTGTVAFSGFYVDNQEYIYNGFKTQNAVFGMGDFRRLNIDGFQEYLMRGVSDIERLSAIQDNSKKIFDGQSKERINSIISSLMRS